MLKLRDIMSQNVVIVEEDTTIKETAVLMASRKVSCVIVVRNNAPLGIVTETDYTRLVVAKAIPVEKPVSVIMSSPLMYASPDTSVMDAAKYMTDNHIKKVPVVDGTLVSGIVTQTDVVRNLFKNVLELENQFKTGAITSQDFVQRSSTLFDNYTDVLQGRIKEWHMRCMNCNHAFMNTERNGILLHKSCPACNSTSLEYTHTPVI